METANIKFNGGIWSEVLKGRYDLGNYQSASRTCENFIPNRYGQVEKRSGTKHLGYAKEDDRVCVLHPFQYSVNTKFILEFGHQYVRFWSNDLQVLDPDNLPNPLEKTTPYKESELYEIQLRAVNDVIYITHPNHPVRTLTRVEDNVWKSNKANLSLPFVDPDVDSSEVTLTPSATTGNGITITASDVAFSNDPDTGHIGSVLRLQYIDEGSVSPFTDAGSFNVAIPFDPLVAFTVSDSPIHRATSFQDKKYYFEVINDYDPTSAWDTNLSYSVNDVVTFSGSAYICTADTTPSISSPTNRPDFWDEIINPDDAPFYFEDGDNRRVKNVSGAWSFQTKGIWRGDWAVQRSIDGGANYTTIRILSSNEDENYLVEDDEEGVADVKIRIKCLASNWSSAQEQNVTLTVLPTASYGTAKVTAVASDGLSVTANVQDEILKAGEPTVLWEESAFSDHQGYPRAIALFDNRLLLAGTRKKPQAFFYSGINDYNNFLARTTLADAPFFVEALSDDQSAIQWLSAQRELFVGTASVEGVLATRKQDEAQSPENLPIVRWNESMGSAHRAALPMRDSLMCLQRGRTTINMLAYSLERDGYTGEEVSLLCNHLFQSGVQQMAHLREPYTGAYTIQEDGTLCHMVYEPKLQVTGWCKFTTQNGDFESVAVIPSSGSDEDEVWCVVKREVNGDTKRHVERFTIDNRAKQEALDTDNLWYVDAGVKATGTDLTSVSGLDHLEGETVCVLADGIKGEYVVSGGVITLLIPADTVIVGLPVVSEFEPLDLEVTYKGGSTYGKRKQLYQSKLMLHKSLGGSIAYDSESYQELIYHTAGEAMDSSIPLKSGYSEVFAEGGHSRQKFWRIKHAEPYPFTLQAVIQSFTMGKH